jgi:hypothetical protein
VVAVVAAAMTTVGADNNKKTSSRSGKNGGCGGGRSRGSKANKFDNIMNDFWLRLCLKQLVL